MMSRYERQIMLPEVGVSGQESFERARVLIVGVGGLGSPVALYLAAAGIGMLGLVDDDMVALSNLQRQILYDEGDVGMAKVEAAERHLRALNGTLTVVRHPVRLDGHNAEALVAGYDVVVDCCDNFATRHLLCATASTLSRPCVYGAIRGFEGQVAVFDARHCEVGYSQLFPSEPPPSPDDRAAMGPAAAVVGGVQAGEVLKIVGGYGTPLYGRLWTIDLRTMQSHLFRF